MIRVHAGIKKVETLVISNAEKEALNLTCSPIADIFIAEHPEFKGCEYSYTFSAETNNWTIPICVVSAPVFVKE